MRINLIAILFAIIVILNNCKKDEDIALLTAPITYAIAKNAIELKKKDGSFNIKLTFSNIRKDENDWPHGEVFYEVEYSEYPGKIYKIQYILNGSHISTAIITNPNLEKKQILVNLVETAVVFGQTQTVENLIQDMAKQLIKGVDNSRRIAVFEFPGTLNEKTILGKRISDSMVTYLVNEKFKVVERKTLEPIFNEINFQNSGLVGDEVRSKIGELLGANTILIGNLKQERHEILINARMVDLESGIIISSTSQIIPKYFFQDKDFRILSQ